MAITRDDVLHVAALARLELTEDEISRLEVQLNDILEAVGKVSELDLSDVPPTSHPLDVVNAFRPDEPRPSLPLEDVFANARSVTATTSVCPRPGRRPRDRHAPSHRRGGARAAPAQGGLWDGAARGLPRGDRRAQRGAELLPHARRR